LATVAPPMPPPITITRDLIVGDGITGAVEAGGSVVVTVPLSPPPPPQESSVDPTTPATAEPRNFLLSMIFSEWRERA
jgi:hypothetical protein